MKAAPPIRGDPGAAADRAASVRRRGAALPTPVLLGLALLVCLALLQRQYRLTVVIGESMSPTFRSGDLMIVDRLAYREGSPRRGDVVVATHRDDTIVKRVVGLPGEEVEVRQGVVLVNGHPARLEHPTREGLLTIGRGRLAEGRFAVLGDNFALPANQQVHAVVSRERILGRVVGSVRWWRLGREGDVPAAKPTGRDGLVRRAEAPFDPGPALVGSRTGPGGWRL